MPENFEAMLNGGHHNSLGRTVEVVDLVLSDRERMEELFGCWFSEDEIVRLRVASAMKRITKAHPEWTMDYMDRLQGDVAEIDQASTRWTLAILFDDTESLLSGEQKARALEIMKRNLENESDWIVLNTTMQVLFDWSKDSPELCNWLQPHLVRLEGDSRKSVAKRAAKFRAGLA